MSRQTQPVKLTYEDYVRIPEDGNRHEIILGEHYVTPAPNTTHQRILVRLTRIIDTVARDQRLGELLVAPVDVVLSPTNIVQPDLVFVCSARTSIITHPNIQGAPDLAIEILCKGTRRRDETLKRKLYEQFGVREYWLVDPELEAVKVYRLSASGYTLATELSKRSADRLTTPLLPGLDLPLSEIFP